MRRAAIMYALLAGAVAVSPASTALPQQVQNTLTTIDTVPTRAQLDSAFGNSPQMALQNLSAIAGDDTADVGIRLRAIHALAKYCGDPLGAPAVPCTSGELAHQSLTAIIGSTASQLSGSQVLLLRAALETIGTLRVSSDVTALVPLLNHPSRDIRTATARALRDLCNVQAISPLRVRYQEESTDQVRLAISEALRILGQCAP